MNNLKVVKVSNGLYAIVNFDTFVPVNRSVDKEKLVLRIGDKILVTEGNAYRLINSNSLYTNNGEITIVTHEDYDYRNQVYLTDTELFNTIDSYCQEIYNQHENELNLSHYTIVQRYKSIEFSFVEKTPMVNTNNPYTMEKSVMNTVYKDKWDYDDKYVFDGIKEKEEYLSNIKESILSDFVKNVKGV